MPEPVSALEGYEDWPAFMDTADTAASDNTALARVLGVPAITTLPDVTTDHEEVRDGVVIARVSWQLEFGPRTQAYLLRPEGARTELPAVLALHCHSGNKWLGAERLVDLGSASSQAALNLRAANYQGHALANDLARRGFVVLAHDTFAWGSRRFNLDPAPVRSARYLAGQRSLWRDEHLVPTEELVYNTIAADHENTVAKACTLLGTTFPGMVAHDDLAALSVLASHPQVDPTRIGAIGHSGGGGRAMVLAALSPLVRSHVVTCMMTTLRSLLPSYLDSHSWLLHIPGLAALADWPEVPFMAHRSGRRSLLVQYASNDRLFPAHGMHDADQILTAHSSSRLAYSGTWWDGDHAMDARMQEEAATFLSRMLTAA